VSRHKRPAATMWPKAMSWLWAKPWGATNSAPQTQSVSRTGGQPRQEGPRSEQSSHFEASEATRHLQEYSA